MHSILYWVIEYNETQNSVSLKKISLLTIFITGVKPFLVCANKLLLMNTSIVHKAINIVYVTAFFLPCLSPDSTYSVHT